MNKSKRCREKNIRHTNFLTFSLVCSSTTRSSSSTTGFSSGTTSKSGSTSSSSSSSSDTLPFSPPSFSHLFLSRVSPITPSPSPPPCCCCCCCPFSSCCCCRRCGGGGGGRCGGSGGGCCCGCGESRSSPSFRLAPIPSATSLEPSPHSTTPCLTSTESFSSTPTSETTGCPVTLRPCSCVWKICGDE